MTQYPRKLIKTMFNSLINNNPNGLRLLTDCSKTNLRTGAAAVLDKDVFQIRLSDHTSTVTAELHAILLSLTNHDRSSKDNLQFVQTPWVLCSPYETYTVLIQ